LRNEEDILSDTLDHLASIADAIVVFDDASIDNSVNIAKNHDSVIEVIVNKRWRRNQRSWEETANRRILLTRAKLYNPDWIFYSDADERFEGNIKGYLLNECPDSVSGIKISLFDAYITENDKKPYRPGDALYGFRRYFGIEQRDILMVWRNQPSVNYIMHDSREPQGIRGEIITKFYCQHYGKSLSIKQWEDTCSYYSDNFPAYSVKWEARKGKAIHNKSDFDTDLLEWDDVKTKGVLIN